MDMQILKPDYNSSLFVRALKQQAVVRPPVWLMRQAGRYLEEYRALKERHGFMGLVKTPELALEVSLQPIRYLNVDAAIVFSDILVPCEAMGIKLTFDPGPKIANPLKNEADVRALRTDAIASQVSFLFETIRNLRASLPPEKAVIGFAGAPWTLACYLLDQGPIKHFHGTQVFARREKQAFALLMDKLTDVVIEYLQSQIESGVQAVQLFDTWAGNLQRCDYRAFALPYTKRIIEALRGFPTILYVNGCEHLLNDMQDTGATCLSLDWRVSLKATRARLGNTPVLQGNFDPTELFASSGEVRTKTLAMLGELSSHTGYIANLGHGVLPTTPRENVLTFVKTVQELSAH